MLNGSTTGLGEPLLGVNAIIWFALFAMLKFAVDDKDAIQVRPTDIVLFALMLIAALLPMHFAAAGMLFFAAVIALFQSKPATGARRISYIALALSVPLLWSPMTLAFFGREVTYLESVIVTGLTGLETNRNVLIGLDGSQYIIAGGCSVLANLSLMTVVLTCFAGLFEVRQPRLMVLWGVAGMVGVILINSMRLASLAYFPNEFAFLHDGIGRMLFGMASVVLMLFVAIMGVLADARRRA